MRKMLKVVMVCMLVLGFVAYFSGSAAAGKAVVIEGTLNEDLELVAEDGKIYEIGENDMAETLLSHKGKRIKIKGNLDDEYDDVIIVTSFDVLED